MSAPLGLGQEVPSSDIVEKHAILRNKMRLFNNRNYLTSANDTLDTGAPQLEGDWIGLFVRKGQAMALSGSIRWLTKRFERDAMKRSA